MIRAHRIRLNPTPDQAAYFAKAAGTRRFVYNWGLAEWKKQYEAGERLSARDVRNKFNSIKKKEFPWVYEVTKCVVDGAFEDLGKAFKNFFEGLAAKRKVGYPKFKAKKRSRDGFYLANNVFSVETHWIYIPKLGRVNMTEVLRFEGKILSARITRTAKWWFVSITVETQEGIPSHQGGMVGIDLGISRLATLSDGTGFENQKPLRHLLHKIKQAHRALCRKQKGSQNRDKARLKLARLYYRVSCVRDDTLHKMTTAITETYGFIGLEDLNVKGMMKNHYLAQALSDVSLGRFETFLIAKAAARGSHIQWVDRFFPSSKRCHACHKTKVSLTLNERSFVCEQCGLTCDRDHNASLNILQEAIRLFESSR
jgi:putative transposase